MFSDVKEVKARNVFLKSIFGIIRSFYQIMFRLLGFKHSEQSKFLVILLTLGISIVFSWLIVLLFIIDLFLILFLPSLHIFKPLFKAGWKYGLITAIGVTLAVSIISQYVFFIYSYQYQAFDLYLKDEPRTFIQVQIDSVHIQSSYTQPYLIDRIAERSLEEMNVSENFLQRDLFFRRGTFTDTWDPITKESYLPNLPLFGVNDRMGLFLSNHLTQGSYPLSYNEVIVLLTEDFYRHSTIRVNSTIRLYIPVSLQKQASISSPGAQTQVKVSGIIFIDNLTDFSIIGSSKGIPFEYLLGLMDSGAVIAPWITGAKILENIELTYGYASIFENLFYDITTIDTFDLDSEINKLKQITIKLEEAYFQLGGYTGVDINSYLLESIEDFQEEYNLYQIFMFAFLAPIIILTLILTIYAANLVRKKREKQLTILSERGTTKLEIGSYLALESIIFGVVALVIGIIIGIPISAILTKSSGFLSFSNPVINLQIEVNSVSLALLGSVATILAIQMINVVTLLKRRSTEDYGRVEKHLPSFYKYYLDFALIGLGAILW
ncbi:MAG: FtsX-like permease family protein, partial [Candidatus Heimdallarchaeaceae archaeon]